MPMRPPGGALHHTGRRRLRLDSNQTAKIQVHVPPGDELEVSEDVAAQLVAGSTHFKPAEDVTDATPADAPAEEQAPAKKPTAKKTPGKKTTRRRRRPTKS